LDINILFIYVIQIVQDNVALSLVKTDDSVCHGTVHPKGLPARRRVNAHKRVNSLNILGTCFGMIAVEVRMRRAVHSRPPIDNLAKFWR
jgi:CTP synthase (UTP-ammonia lyase)